MTKLVLLGEAWGKDEKEYSHAFVGSAGQELYRMLGDAGFHSEHLPYNFVSPYSMIKRWEALGIQLLNVFNCRPPDPDFKNRAEYFYGHPKTAEDPLDKALPPRRFGQRKLYVLEKYSHHIKHLHEELNRIKPNLVIALGNTPLWALGLPTGIGKLRGSVIECNFGKNLPLYHPAAVLRNWSFRIVSVIDFIKARREQEYAEIKVIERFIWAEPSVEDLYKWWEEYGKHSKMLAVDIETLRKAQISEISFAASSTQALHIPFVIEHKVSQQKTYTSWWKDLETEVKAWKFVKMVLESPIPKIGQNVFQYDTYWLIKELGFVPKNLKEDTMVKAHCWQPEMKKDLGFLGSIFLDERSWKGIRTDVSKGEA